MKIFLRRMSLTVIAMGLASFSWAQAPGAQAPGAQMPGAQTPESTQNPQSDPTAPQAASSPHQRESTTTSANEAANPSETDPAASSTRHQQESTRTRTAEGSDEQDPRMKECLDRVKEKNKGIPEYTARRACREHLRDEADSNSSEG